MIQCSTTCGIGIRQRTTQCYTHTNRIVDSKHCSKKPRPILTENCKDYSSCETIWRTSHWSAVSLLLQTSFSTLIINFTPQCQGKCCETNNYQRRTVDCIALVANRLITVPDKYCIAGGTKPHTIRICNRTDCPEWVVGEWGQCSVTCGIGEQQRRVKCLLGEQELTSCCREKPSQLKTCTNPDCGQGKIYFSE